MERPVSRRVFTGSVLALAVGAALPAWGQVHIDINLPGPPRLVPVPSSPAIAYAPGVNANYFSYGGEYYVFSDGAWYASRRYNGPWFAVRPEVVPRPLLGVPVRYYHRPPAAWRQWRREAAPRWDAHYGRRWDERRHEGQALPRERREDRRDDHRDGRDGHRDDRR